MIRQSIKSLRHLLVTSLATSFICLVAPFAGATDKRNHELFSQLEFRYIGPVGNRVSAVAGIPGDPKVYLNFAEKLGAHKTFTKPVDSRSLINAVKELLG